MKLKLKLKSTPATPLFEKEQYIQLIQHPFDVEKAIKAHDKEWPPDEAPYNEWIDSKDIPPPNMNEDILVYYPERKHHELARSFVLLQNVLYRKATKHPVEHFYWMRFRGYDGQNAYPE